MIAFVVTTYAFIEYNNYVKYKKKYELFNNFRNKTEHNNSSILNKKIDVIHSDIKNSHTEMKSFIQEMFKGFNQIEKIPKLKIVRSLVDNLCFSSVCETINEKIKSMITDVENIIGVKFENSENSAENNIKHVSISNGKLVVWYRPVALQWILFCARSISCINMSLIGFKKHLLDDNVIVWVKNNNSDKCTLFVPSCVGGITLYQTFIKLLCNKLSTNNIYIVEIPGMAWTGYTDNCPPSISKISNTIVKFIVNNKIKNLNMFGHSFGTIVMNHIVNEQYQILKESNIKLNKIIYIEGLLFYVKVFKTLKCIEMPLLDVLFGDTSSDVFTMPLFQRDLYVKFYIKRHMSLLNSVLCGDSECEAECDFYSLMVEHDNKFITKDYVDYINKKQLRINYKVFNGLIHGSFVWTKEMQDYLFNILN